MARDAQRDEFHAPNSFSLQAITLADRRGRSTQELMADARQARAEGLLNMIWALARQVRLSVVVHILQAKQPSSGAAPPSRPGA